MKICVYYKEKPVYLFRSTISISVNKSLFPVQKELFNPSATLRQDANVSCLDFRYGVFVNCIRTLLVLSDGSKLTFSLVFNNEV